MVQAALRGEPGTIPGPADRAGTLNFLVVGRCFLISLPFVSGGTENLLPNFAYPMAVCPRSGTPSALLLVVPRAAPTHALAKKKDQLSRDTVQFVPGVPSPFLDFRALLCGHH